MSRSISAASALPVPAHVPGTDKSGQGVQEVAPEVATAAPEVADARQPVPLQRLRTLPPWPWRTSALASAVSTQAPPLAFVLPALASAWTSA